MKQLFVIGSLLLTLLFASTASADNPIALDEYRRAVAQALALARQAEPLGQSERVPLLNQAAALLEPIRAVQLPSGAQTAVDNTALLALLRDASKTKNSVARLTALRDALAEPLPAIHANDLATLETILKRPPFVSESGATPQWLDDILRRIGEWIDRLFTNTTRGIFAWRDVIVLIGIVLVAVVLIFFIVKLRRNLVPEETLAPLLPEHAVRTPGQAFNNAQHYINQGDYRSAVRQLYLATLLLLDQRGKLKYDPTLTNREYLHQTANDPRTTAALVPIVETFDRTWYGFEPISRQEFDAYRERVEAVREL